MKNIIKTLRFRKAKTADSEELAVPRITNDTVAEHREQVLGSARKYIYPLQHSKRRIVVITATLLAIAVAVFFISCLVALYRFQSTGTFIYDVTKVLPFPVAKAGSSYVSYENYLFELRRYEHYYTNEQKLDFSTKDGKTQLANYKKQALQKVETDAYVKQLAQQHAITVSNHEVDDEVTLLRNQNRLGSSGQVFQDVLQEYWGWSVSDFKRELKTQLLSQKVAATLDTATQQRAQQALAAVQKGTDFGATATQYSDDQVTKANGGQYSAAIDHGSQSIAPQVLDAIFRLKAGQTSGLINTGDSLQIVKVLDTDGSKAHAAVIVCNFKDISNFIGPLQQQHKPRNYIKL